MQPTHQTQRTKRNETKRNETKRNETKGKKRKDYAFRRQSSNTDNVDHIMPHLHCNTLHHAEAAHHIGETESWLPHSLCQQHDSL